MLIQQRIRLALLACLCVGLLLATSCGREAPFTLPTPTGEILVLSSETGAAILLNGVPTGRVTPDTIPDLEIGDYRVAVRLAAHASDPDHLDLRVLANEVLTAEFDLLLTGIGRIAVTSAPAGATIWLNDEDTGRVTPDTIPDVLVGANTVSVSLDGYEADPPDRAIDVVENQVHDADFALVVPPPAIVLLEEFSNISCLGCPDMAAVTHAVQSTDGYGLDRVLLVNISGTFPSPLDPHYLGAKDAHDTRLTYYDAFTGLNFPSLMLNGALEYEANPGVDPLGYDELVELVDTALAGSPGFTITLGADLSEVEIAVAVTLASVRTIDLTNCFLGVYLVEEEIDYPRGAPGDNGQSIFHWILRDYDQIDAVLPTLEPGSPLILNATLTRNLSWNDVIAIAFVQERTSHQILQAGSTAAVSFAGQSSAHHPNSPSSSTTPIGGTP